MERLNTIITVVFNGVHVLEETIKCVVRLKEGSNIQYIVIDGGSTDGTLDIIEKYKKNINYFISENDAGIYNAMNKGCTQAAGDGLIFLNAGDVLNGNVFSDDWLPPYFIDCVVKNGNVLKNKKIKKVTTGMPTSHQAIVFKNKKLYYDERYKISADYEFLIKNGIDENLPVKKNAVAIYDNDGISSNKYWIRDFETAEIMLKKFGYTPAMFFLSKQVIKNIIKMLFKWR